MVTAEDDRQRAGAKHLGDRRLDRRVRASGQSILASRCGPGGQLAARIARGPNRVPGRSDTRSSTGAPTIATSMPPSSAGSCVYGRPA